MWHSALSAVIGILVLLPLTSLGALPRRERPASGPVATPVQPTVEFQVVPGRDSLGRGENVTFYILISNKSIVTLENIDCNIIAPPFETIKAPGFPTTLPPFGSDRQEIDFLARDSAAFATHKLLFMLKYAWDIGGGRKTVSAQSATVPVQITRRFEEEAKGFPGGTAAFLYLLLPIIPAILSYQFVENLRKGQGAQMPAFKTEYVVPAFFAAVALSFLMLFAFNRDKGLNYSDPRVFMTVLLSSLVIGALLPGFRWAVRVLRMRRWGFDNTDNLQSYLRKALLMPDTPREFHWVTGKINDEQWQGVLLKQIDGTTVLGQRLQVSPAGQPDQEVYKNRWARLTQNVLNADGVLLDRKQLVNMVKTGELELSALENVKRGDQNINEPVMVDGMNGFQQTGDQVKPFIEPKP